MRKDDANGTYLQGFQYGATNQRLFDYEHASGLLKITANGGAIEYTEYQGAVPTWTKTNIYLGNSQLATITPNGAGGELTEYNHPDRLGTRLITNQQSGTSYEQAHLPFGKALSAESTGATSKRFTSYERSSQTGLDYAVNRTYDSKQGRFTQVDPIKMSSVSLAAPQTLNLYNYCGNDPINYTDPSGLFFGKLFKWLAKAFKWIAIAVTVAVVVLGFVVAPGSTGFLAKLSAALIKFLAKIGSVLKFASGGLLAAEGITATASLGLKGLQILGGIGAITGYFQSQTSKSGGSCGGPGEPPCEDDEVIVIYTRAPRWSWSDIIREVGKALFGELINFFRRAYNVREDQKVLARNYTCKGSGQLRKFKKSDGLEGVGVTVKLEVTGIRANSPRDAVKKSKGPVWDELQNEAARRTLDDPEWRYEGKHISPRRICTPQ